MTSYRLGCEFDIVRRIGWSDEDLGEHIDTVFERLHQAEGLVAIDAEANLDSGRASVSMTMRMDDDDPRHVACGVLALAIRSCGGAHEGLLRIGEEAVVKPHRNSWSGLRTPTWKVRQIDIADASPS